jgi:threonine/homoserine/homoserine lactone efflux protein
MQSEGRAEGAAERLSQSGVGWWKEDCPLTHADGVGPRIANPRADRRPDHRSAGRPVNLLCIRRTLEKGWKSGIVSGLGAALADTLYGAIAGFGISLVIQLLICEEFWIRMIGGLFLVGIGVVYYRKPPRSLHAGDDDSSANSDFVSAFVLNLTNPTTVLSYIAVLATLGLGRQRALWQTSLLVAGIFCGSMTWWTILVSAANRLRSRITDHTMRWMNHVAGIAIGAFGLVNVLLSRGHRHWLRSLVSG